MQKESKWIRARDYTLIPIIVIGLLIVSMLPSMVWGETIQTMEVNYPYLEFSQECKLHNNQAHIKVSGGLSRWNSEDLYYDLMLARDMGVDRINIYLNSPGGSAAQGLCITDELRIFREANPGIPIYIYARGLIASAAVPVLLQGTHRIVSASTIFLIHPAQLIKWGLFSETLKDLESQSTMIRMFQDRYAHAIQSRSDLDYDQVVQMMGEDTWFDAKQALMWGFVDEVN